MPAVPSVGAPLVLRVLSAPFAIEIQMLYESIEVYDYSSHELLMNITRLGKAKAPCERELLEAPSRGGN